MATRIDSLAIVDWASVVRNAASTVKAIAGGRWTNEPPDWADADSYLPPTGIGAGLMCHIDYTRAVQTAEAFILLFQIDPTFDSTRFLVACGLVDAKRKAR